jgi:hypothetical protein
MGSLIEPVRAADTETLGDFLLPGMVLLVLCDACRHRAEFGEQFIRRRMGVSTTVFQLRQRLKCRGCGQRRALVLTYRMPR